MANEIAGPIYKNWQTNIDQVREFMFGLKGDDDYTCHYSFRRSPRDTTYTICSFYKYGNDICGKIRLSKNPELTIDLLADDLKQSSLYPSTPLPRLALFYIISLAHYKMCCMELQVQCRKKRQHQTAMEYV